MAKQILLEHNFDTKPLCEEVGGKKIWTVHGTFLSGSDGPKRRPNKNGRCYPMPILESAVKVYETNYIKTNMSAGELQHPSSLTINPDRVSHIITEMTRDGNFYVGKAKILNTDCGRTVMALLEGGLAVGISSRGNGSIINEDGISVVQNDYSIVACDLVLQPSGEACFINGLVESAGFIWNTLQEDTRFLEELKKDIKKTPSKRLDEAKLQAFQKFMDRLKTI